MYCIIYKIIKEHDREPDELVAYAIKPAVSKLNLPDVLKGINTKELLAVLPNNVDPQILAYFLKL